MLWKCEYTHKWIYSFSFIYYYRNSKMRGKGEWCVHICSTAGLRMSIIVSHSTKWMKNEFQQQFFSFHSYFICSSFIIEISIQSNIRCVSAWCLSPVTDVTQILSSSSSLLLSLWMIFNILHHWWWYIYGQTACARLKESTTLYLSIYKCIFYEYAWNIQPRN